MDFTDDLSLIDHDIEQFRSNKEEYWLDKLHRDNSRLYVNTQVRDESHAAENFVKNPVTYNPKYINPNTNYNGRRERNLLQVSEPRKRLDESMRVATAGKPERKLKVLQKLIIDEDYKTEAPGLAVGKGPIYTSSLSNRPKTRSLKVMKNATDNLASIGLVTPKGDALPIVNGPVYNHTLQRGLDVGSKGAFHLNRTPIELEKHFPTKSKREFFDENNAEEEHMFSMYDVGDDDFKI